MKRYLFFIFLTTASSFIVSAHPTRKEKKASLKDANRQKTLMTPTKKVRFSESFIEPGSPKKVRFSDLETKALSFPVATCKKERFSKNLILQDFASSDSSLEKDLQKKTCLLDLNCDDDSCFQTDSLIKSRRASPKKLVFCTANECDEPNDSECGSLIEINNQEEEEYPEKRPFFSSSLYLKITKKIKHDQDRALFQKNTHPNHLTFFENQFRPVPLKQYPPYARMQIEWISSKEEVSFQDPSKMQVERIASKEDLSFYDFANNRKESCSSTETETRRQNNIKRSPKKDLQDDPFPSFENLALYDKD